MKTEEPVTLNHHAITIGLQQLRIAELEWLLKNANENCTRLTAELRSQATATDEERIAGIVHDYANSDVSEHGWKQKLARAIRKHWPHPSAVDTRERTFGEETPPQYRVLTWDMELQKFTPQDGVPEIATGPGELRDALRQLRQGGYSADRSDPSILVERIDESEPTAEPHAPLASPGIPRCDIQRMKVIAGKLHPSDNAELFRAFREIMAWRAKATSEKLDETTEQPERTVWLPEPDCDGDYQYPDGQYVMKSKDKPGQYFICKRTGMEYFPTKEAAAQALYDLHCGPWHPPQCADLAAKEIVLTHEQAAAMERLGMGPATSPPPVAASEPREPIPTNTWWNESRYGFERPDGLYCAGAFFLEWHPRRDEFPTAPPATEQPVPTGEAFGVVVAPQPPTAEPIDVMAAIDRLVSLSYPRYAAQASEDAEEIKSAVLKLLAERDGWFEAWVAVEPEEDNAIGCTLYTRKSTAAAECVDYERPRRVLVRFAEPGEGEVGA